MDVAATNLQTVEDADFRQVANPTNTLVLPENSTRGDTVQHLSVGIPKNEYGLPLYFLRSDLLDWTQIEAYGYLSSDDADRAAEILDYSDGYPVQRSGSPFWSQLTHEPFEAFQLFKYYLELVETEGIRLHDTLASEQGKPLKTIREIAKEYYWSARARAYDLFVVAAEAKRREARTRKTESEHFSVAGGIIDSIINRINGNPDLIEKMEATELFDLFEKMVKIQRMSLGLVGQNASTNNQMPSSPGSTVEVILRSLTQNNGLSSEAGQSIGDRLKLMMGDEKTAIAAQELVIRATTPNSVYSSAKDTLPSPLGGE